MEEEGEGSDVVSSINDQNETSEVHDDQRQQPNQQKQQKQNGASGSGGKNIFSQKKSRGANRKSVAFSNLQALTKEIKKEQNEGTADILSVPKLDPYLEPPSHEPRNYDSLLTNDESHSHVADHFTNRLDVTNDDAVFFRNEKDILLEGQSTESTTTTTTTTTMTGDNQILGLPPSLLPPTSPRHVVGAIGANQFRNDEETSLLSHYATNSQSSPSSSSLDAKMLELVVGLVQVQSKTEANVEHVSEQIMQKDKTIEALLNCFIQTQKSIEEMKTTVVASRSRKFLASGSGIVQEYNEETERFDDVEDEEAETLRSRLGKSMHDQKQLKQENEKLQAENVGLRKMLDKNKRKIEDQKRRCEDQESQLEALNSNYSQALIQAKTHWETIVLEREKTIFKWKQQYDVLLEDNKRLKQICSENTRQIRSGQLETVNKTLVSLQSGKIMRLGPMGTGNGEEDLGFSDALRSGINGNVTTMELLKKANKVSGTADGSFFECLTSKKDTD